METLTLDWTLRQPKDSPWCFDLEDIYPCGCNPYNGNEDGRYECIACHPLRVYLEMRDRRAARGRGRPSELFLAHQEYIDSSRFSLLGPLGRLSRVLKTYYMPAIVDQLNSPMLMSLVAEKNALYRPGAE